MPQNNAYLQPDSLTGTRFIGITLDIVFAPRISSNYMNDCKASEGMIKRRYLLAETKVAAAFFNIT